MPVTMPQSSHTRTIFPTGLYGMQAIRTQGLIDARPDTEPRAEPWSRAVYNADRCTYRGLISQTTNLIIKSSQSLCYLNRLPYRRRCCHYSDQLFYCYCYRCCCCRYSNCSTVPIILLLLIRPFHSAVLPFCLCCFY